MSYQVVLYPENITFDIEKGQTVLDAALNSNINFPNRCQVGACAMCLCNVHVQKTRRASQLPP